MLKKKNLPGCGEYEFTDLPVDYVPGEPRLEMIGDRCLVDGLDSIEEYKPDKIRLKVGKRHITFVGNKLHINCFTRDGAIVEGTIMRVEFSD